VKALDTNTLIRYLVEDEPAMANAIARVLTAAEENGDSFYVSQLVVLEMNWVLSSCYRYSRNEVLDALDELLLLPVLTFESPECVSELIAVGRVVDLDLADILIGLWHRNAGCETTLTFDRRATASPLFEALV